MFATTRPLTQRERKIELQSISLTFEHCVLRARDLVCTLTKIHGYELSRNQRQHPVGQSRGGPSSHMPKNFLYASSHVKHGSSNASEIDCIMTDAINASSVSVSGLKLHRLLVAVRTAANRARIIAWSRVPAMMLD